MGLTNVTGLTPRGAATVRRLTVCRPKIAEFVPVTFLQLTMAQEENFMFQTHQTVCQEPPTAQAAKAATGGRGLGWWRHLFIAGTTLEDDDQPLD